MSYSQFDDKHDRGKITEFREELSGEVQAVTGAPFHIFQDRVDIRWGQEWRKRIERSIESATFFIPIVTPSFFTHPACREEAEAFLSWSSRLHASDRLILPLYYISCAVLEDELKRRSDSLAARLNEIQYADWRKLRGTSIRLKEARSLLHNLALRIADALRQENDRQITDNVATPGQQAGKILFMRPGLPKVPNRDEDRVRLVRALRDVSFSAADWRTLAIEVSPLLDHLMEASPFDEDGDGTVDELMHDLASTLNSVLTAGVTSEQLRAANRRAERLRDWLLDALDSD